MCHPGFPLISLRDLARQRRWNALERPVVVQRATTQQTATVAVEAVAQGGERRRLRCCVCSPTRHPGSFRCRHHHDEYVWGGGSGNLLQAAASNN